MITLCMGIPTINQADLLMEALGKYKNTWHGRNIWVIDNGNQDIISEFWLLKIIKSPTNLGVAASWNALCRFALNKGYTHIALLNDDVLWERLSSDIEDFIIQNKADIYIGQKSNWSVAIISLDAWVKIGPFDEGFYPAYFEDNDYMHRAKLLGMKVMKSIFFEPEIYRNSESIKKDPSLNVNFEKNKMRYFEKWGGFQGEEKYLTPFNK